MSGRRIMTGTVKSDKTQKTRTVVVEQYCVHSRFGKRLKRFTTCHVHDEFNASRQGDLVEIMECRPRSRLKRWELVRVVKRGANEADPERQARINLFSRNCELLINWLETVYLHPAEEYFPNNELHRLWDKELRSYLYRDPLKAQVFQAFLCEPSPNRRRDLAVCLHDAFETAGGERGLSKLSRQHFHKPSGVLRVTRPRSELPLDIHITPPSPAELRVGKESLWTVEVISTPDFPGTPAPRRRCLEFNVEHGTARQWPSLLLVPFGLARPQRRDFVVVPTAAGKLSLRVDCRYAGHVLACVEQFIEVTES